MKVLVVGSGAREHALVWKLQFCHDVTAVYAAPGNAGISFLARVAPIPADDVRALAQYVLENAIDLTVVGPEGPLAAGIADEFHQWGLRIFGPSKAAAQVETSKLWAKEIMQRHGVPTARWAAAKDPDEARARLRDFGLPVVVKADGLAGGKGVVVCTTTDEAETVVQQFMVEGLHGAAGHRLVIEEFLEGQELSVFALADGEHVLPLIGARDYKPLQDGDQGPNTGGMGGFAPAPSATPELLAEVQRTILEPTVRGLADAGAPYIGVLYAGLMLTASGPKVLEYNCRWGDPEAELILPLLRTDLVELMEACLEGRLDETVVEWHPATTCGVVLAGPSYPTHPDRGTKIQGLDDVEDGVLAFHGGTRLLRSPDSRGGWLKRTLRPLTGADLGVVTDGGRILMVVATGPTLADARAKAYANVDKIQFDGMRFRRDIGLEALGHASTPPRDSLLASSPRPDGDAGGGGGASSKESTLMSPEPAVGAAAVTTAHEPSLEPGPSDAPLQQPSPTSNGPIDRPVDEQSFAGAPSAAQAPATEPDASRGGPRTTIVAVLMGSESDRPVMDETVKVLEELDIPSEVHVLSAHRTPERVREFARSAAGRGIRVVIAGAGGAAHLPGVIAAQTTLPVIGVPIAGSALMGLDALLSIVQMPGGVPVATVAVGTAGARNAAYFAAAMLGLADERIRARYGQFRAEQSGGDLL